MPQKEISVQLELDIPQVLSQVPLDTLPALLIEAEEPTVIERIDLETLPQPIPELTDPALAVAQFRVGVQTLSAVLKPFFDVTAPLRAFMRRVDMHAEQLRG